MKTVTIHLAYINDVRDIVNAANEMKCEVDLISGRYIIDAKSIMGIFSLDFSKPITVQVHGTDEDANMFFEKIKPYIQE